MPRPRKYPARKPRRKSAPKRARKARRAVGSANNDKAHIVETYDSQVRISPNSAGTIYFNIADFNRAPLMASQFQQYKANKVEITFHPEFNTFQESTGTSATIPYLLHCMNRIGEQQNIDAQQMERRGATPIKFTRPIKLSYKPNNLSGTISNHYNVVTANGQEANALWSYSPVFNKWHSSEILTGSYISPPAVGADTAVALTPPNYYGMDYFFVQDNAGAEPVTIGFVTIKVSWSFKQARSVNNANQATARPALCAFQNPGP